MHESEDRARRVGLPFALGVGFLLVYALPVFFPPPPVWIVPATADTPVLTRIFPHVPDWWVVGRLLALVAGALLVAGASRDSVLRFPPIQSAPTSDESSAALRLAFLAGLIHIVCLPFVRQLPYFAKTLYVLWTFAPAAILLLWRTPRAWRWERGQTWPRWASSVGVLIGIWIVVRLAASWHSPIAADCVDMFRTLGGLVRLATTDADFLTESMGVTEGVGDIEVVGVNAVQLFFEGLPLLRLFSHSPCLWWMQVVNAMWLALAAVVCVALCRSLVGSIAATFAAAAFLFSPYVLMAQILPIPTVCFPLAALLLLLPVRFCQSGSSLVLVFFGGVAGLTAMLPSQTLMTGVAILVVAWRIWRGPRVSRLAIVTAILSFTAMCTPNIPSRTALATAYDWYVTKDWPMVVGEATLQGQISPSIASWTKVKPADTPLLIAGTLLSPFAIPRNSLRNFGDVLYEPLSAALSAVGLIICLRRAARDRASLYLLAFLAAGFVPGFVSSYDRVSLTRIYGTTVSLSILAAIGLTAVLGVFRGFATRRRAATAAAAAVVVSGLVVFDVVNPRILSSSTWGILMRSVEADSLNRVAMLTTQTEAMNPPDVEHDTRLWEADWLHHYHPYIDHLARCAPREPIEILNINNPDVRVEHDIVFWNPALEQTVELTERYVCRTWPNATLYTIFDRNFLSRVYAAHVRGPGWTPSVPAAQWRTSTCAEGLEVPELWKMLDATMQRPAAE